MGVGSPEPTPELPPKNLLELRGEAWHSTPHLSSSPCTPENPWEGAQADPVGLLFPIPSTQETEEQATGTSGPESRKALRAMGVNSGKRQTSHQRALWQQFGPLCPLHGSFQPQVHHSNHSLSSRRNEEEAIAHWSHLRL